MAASTSLATPISSQRISWLDLCATRKRQFLEPLQACIYDQISPEKIAKTDSRGYKKYYPFTVYTRRQSHTFYIYQASLTLLGLSVDEMNRKKNCYYYVSNGLKRLNEEKKWRLRLFYPIFKQYLRHEQFQDVCKPQEVDPNFLSYNKYNLVRLFLGAIMHSSRQIRSSKLSNPVSDVEQLICTTSWRLPEGMFNAIVTYDAVSIFSPIGTLKESGSFCKAYRVFNYTEGCVQIQLKPNCIEFPENGDDLFANAKNLEHMKRGIKITEYLYKKSASKRLYGIVDAPAILAYSKPYSATIYQDTITTKYDYPLDEYVFNPTIPSYQISSIVSCIRQLFHAITYLRKHHVIHGDIKMENILVKGTATFALADFGGAILESEAAPNLNSVLQTTFSDVYVNGNDLLQIVGAVKNSALKTWREISYARDLAATALVCLQMVARKEILPERTTHLTALHALYDGCEGFSGEDAVKKFPSLLDLSQIQPTTIESAFKSAGIRNTSLIQLFKRCLSNNYRIRPVAKYASAHFTAIAPLVLCESTL